ncbi:MAG: hypothetical protein WC740_22985 [Verrucomicrobiia bacterium]
MKGSNRIWGTAAILILAIVGCAAGLVIISSHKAKMDVRRNRVANIDLAIRQALDTAKEALNKRFADAVGVDLPGNTRTIDIEVARQLVDKHRRVFNFCEEEISALNSQRQQNERVIYDLMRGVNECTILTVVCVILGFYSAFWLQRYA